PVGATSSTLGPRTPQVSAAMPSLRERLDSVVDRWPRRIPGAGTGASIVLVTLVSTVAALIAVRFGGPDGPWLWNYDMAPFMAPFATLLHEAVSAGRLPLWHDTVAMGMPIAAEGQMGALYPPNWLIFQLPPLAGLDATRIIHLVLAGVGA